MFISQILFVYEFLSLYLVLENFEEKKKREVENIEEK